MIRLVLVSVLATTPSVAANLNVHVYGGIPSKGQLLVALFASKADWMKTPTTEKIVPIDGDGEARFIFPEISPGFYGVSIIYDENADGELDLNLLGIPSEGFGFSNDARATFGPPDWSETRFEIGEPETTVSIRLDRAD